MREEPMEQEVREKQNTMWGTELGFGVIRSRGGAIVAGNAWQFLLSCRQAAHVMETPLLQTGAGCTVEWSLYSNQTALHLCYKSTSPHGL